MQVSQRLTAGVFEVFICTLRLELAYQLSGKRLCIDI